MKEKEINQLIQTKNQSYLDFAYNLLDNTNFKKITKEKFKSLKSAAELIIIPIEKERFKKLLEEKK